MAEDQGQRKDLYQTIPWLKLFSGFKVALDPKKLLLAAAGILAMSLGWWVLAWFFMLFRSATPPKFTDAEYSPQSKAEWKIFKEDRRRWNRFYEMAGSAPKSLQDAYKADAADFAESLEEFRFLEVMISALQASTATAKITLVKEAPALEIGGQTYAITADKDFKLAGPIRAADIRIVDAKTGKAILQGTNVTIENAGKLQAYLAGARSEEQLRRQHAGRLDLVAKALVLAKDPPFKSYGKLRLLPWSEYRGPNPYLLVTGNVAGPDNTRAHPWQQGHFVHWLATDQVPVLLEPLYKFLRPVVYLFRSGSGGWNSVYLFLVILWALAVWGFFGGAITRMAAVQVARHNEKVGMMEALRFARSRFQSFFSAPLFPLIFLAVIAVFLIVFGFIEGVTWAFGDILFVGFLWPLALIAGLVMAVVLVGLVGWPLMYSTISAEGSDSFDALSRSYSYVYQAPWHYLWYAIVALAYGAVLVFFVGFMGSLLVYLGKWGLSQPWHPSDREPSYFFMYTPTSFGWRDLMLHNSPEAITKPAVLPNGTLTDHYALSDDYMKTVSWNNKVGAWLVTIWLGLFFLLIVGFGYSYFWSAATIIYLLMRRKVDDTEMDEIHLEEEEEEPFTPPAPPAPAPSPALPQTSAPVMVEAPTLRTPPTDISAGSPPPAPAPEPPPPPPGDGPAQVTP